MCSTTAKNKVRKSGVFFLLGKTWCNAPRSTTQITTNSPRFTSQKHGNSPKTPYKNHLPPRRNFFGKIPKSAFSLKGFSGEVIKRKSEKGEHDDADPVLVEGVVVAEAPELPMTSALFGEALKQTNTHAEEADDAAGGDEAGGVEAAR